MIKHKINHILITKPWSLLICIILYILILRTSIVYCIEPGQEINQLLSTKLPPPSKEDLIGYALSKSHGHIHNANNPEKFLLLRNMNGPSLSYIKLARYIHNPIPHIMQMECITQIMLTKVYNTTFFDGTSDSFEIVCLKQKGFNTFMESYTQCFKGIQKGFMQGSMDLRFHAYNNLIDINFSLFNNSFYFQGFVDSTMKIYKNDSTTAYEKEMIRHLMTVIRVFKDSKSLNEAQDTIYDKEKYIQLYSAITKNL